MGEWLADNWYVVFLIVLYFLERSPEVLRSIKEHAARKAAQSEVNDILDSGNDVAESADNKGKRSTGRKVASGALHLIPFISRIRRIAGK